MKRYKFIAKIIIILLSIAGCNREQSNIINLDTSIKEALYLENNQTVIQLETSQECLLGMMLKVIPDLNSDRVFVLADFNIFIFNSAGRFISKLRVGKGPDEIYAITSFTVDSEKKLIYALDTSNQIVLIDYEGNIVKKIFLTEFYAMDMFVFDDENFLLLNNWVGRNEKHFVGLFNTNEEKIINKFISSEESRYPLNTLVTCMNFSKWNNKVYFYAANIWGLFEYKENSFLKILSIDVGKGKVPAHFYKQFENQNRQIFREEAKLNGYIPFLLYVFPFGDYYLIGLDDEVFTCYAISKKDFSKVIHNGSIVNYFNLPVTKSMRIPIGFFDDTIVFYSNPMDFFEHDDEIKTKKIQIGNEELEINYNDNPIIITIQEK